MVTHERRQRPSKEGSTVVWCPVFITYSSLVSRYGKCRWVLFKSCGAKWWTDVGRMGWKGWEQNKKERGLKEDKYNEIHISAYRAETSKAKGSGEGGQDRGEIIYKGNHLMDTRFLLCCSRCQKAIKSYLQSAEEKQPLNLYIRQKYARTE